MKGLVIKKNADLFFVEGEDGVRACKARGNLKKEGIFVGDSVEYDKTVNALLPRKNLLIRPPLANLDKIFIVISPLPQPDFLLVDKMILCCFAKGITPVLVINKEDIAGDKFVQEVKAIYKNVAKVIVCSARLGKLATLKCEIVGLTAFAGQSAVGKSSLLNAILGEDVSKVGDLSKKIERGKQTTRIVSLFRLGKGYLADTAGFSSLELGMICDIEPQEIARFYPDFLPFLSKCKYRSCNHRRKGQCGVIEGVESGKINQNRYENYLKIFDSLTFFKQKYK